MSRLLRALPAAALLALLAAALPTASSAKTTWLCKPGLASDPCAAGGGTTQLNADGSVKGPLYQRETARPTQVDCFYVYPTVSDQKTPQATKRIDPELRSIALYQAARYNSACRVFAPVYRQITLQGLLQPTTVSTKMRDTAYADVRDAFRDYLKHDNKGRGIVFVGHSQGTAVLRQLLAKEVDAKPAVRKRLVSAILLGGNVTTKDFKHIPACTKNTQLGCVVAFSTFNDTPPPNAVFGKSGSLGGLAHSKGGTVLCTNPAALSNGGPATLTTVFPSKPFAPGTTIGALTTQVGMPMPTGVSTPWLQTQAYTGKCVTENGAHVLRISPLPGAPTLKPNPDPTWGLHLVDANIALGDLDDLVVDQALRYRARA
jgi:pimeloyl-ACP methyl ester carboxylesterase